MYQVAHDLENPITWCYVMYKLAPFSPSILKVKRQELLNKYKITDPSDYRTLFINFILDQIKLERPLFCNFTIEYLFSSRCSDFLSGKPTDILALLSGYLHNLFTRFVIVKKLLKTTLLKIATATIMHSYLTFHLNTGVSYPKRHPKRIYISLDFQYINILDISG